MDDWESSGVTIGLTEVVAIGPRVEGDHGRSGVGIKVVNLRSGGEVDVVISA